MQNPLKDKKGTPEPPKGAAGGAGGGLSMEAVWQQNVVLQSQVEQLANKLDLQVKLLEAEKANKASKIVPLHLNKFDGDSQRYSSFQTEVLYMLELRKNDFRSDQE
ncbi:Hypothetical predicted protein [Podarcis lilfordi]|uniref:Uncharacterized protein n=1 Tax=Podarcis lilfordi TaxID=74358 RepID=A0AA35PSZ6_9SAUR|nr:Hypothetical predicted protein [Podarcis lilfordi]